MKSQEPQEKKFRQLSDQELEKVTGGVGLSQNQCYDKARFGDTCPVTYYEKGDQCCKGGTGTGEGIGTGAGIETGAGIGTGAVKMVE